MASTAAVPPLGLLHMRPLQHWLHSRVPRAVGRVSSLTAVPATAVRQACVSSHGQHCGYLVHQPAGRYTITPHVTARPPSPPLEFHTAQITVRCEPTRTDSVQAQGGRGVSRTHFPRDSPSLAHSSEEGPPFSGARHHMAPASRSVEPSCVVPGRDAADLSGLPQAVVETITQARAPSTRQAYALKCLLANWCSSRREDPWRCTIGVVFSFMQERLERRLSPSTLKVYVSITIHHDAVDDWSLGKHDLIVRILRGARRRNPSRSPLMPLRDLSIILAGLQRGPFEPLDSVELKFLSTKTALLTALTSIKRVGDFQAFSVSEECLVFGPAYSHVVLRPRPGYVHKVTETLCPHATIVNHRWLPETCSRLRSINLISRCTYRPFIPVCTRSGSGMQNPLSNFIDVFS